MDEHFKSKVEQVPKLALNRIETAQAISQSPATVDRLTKRGLGSSRATRRPCTPSRKLNASSRRQPLSRIGQYEINLGNPIQGFPPAFRATTGANSAANEHGWQWASEKRQ